MAANRLYSVAAIAKLLEMPESTLHYWKNRFDDVLPSVGQGRGKRFRPEAVDIFRAIGRLLGQGLSAADARTELVRRYPVNIPHQPPEPENAAAAAAPQAGAFGGEEALALAATLGAEIARSLLAHLGQGLPPANATAGLDAAALAGELAAVRSENACLTEKMRLLENELVRLRKDRRELETYLVDKLNALRRPEEAS